GVHDADALARGGTDVDVVHADAGADDGPQPAGVFEEVGGDLRAAADDGPVGGAEGVPQGGAGQAGPLVEVDAGLAQQVEAGGLQLVADQNATRGGGGHGFVRLSRGKGAAVWAAP